MARKFIDRAMINKWGPVALVLALSAHSISAASLTSAPDQSRPSTNRSAAVNLMGQPARNGTQVAGASQLAAVRQRWRQLDKTLVASLVSSADELAKLLGKARVSPPCSLALAELVDGLAAQRLWASEMLDASARRLPSGLLEGTLSELGNFDQCVQLGQAQYCTLQVRPVLIARPRHHTVCQRAGPASSPVAGNVSLPTRLLAEHSHQFHYAGLRLGVCAPSKCSPADLQQLLSSYLAKGELVGQLKSCTGGKGGRPLDGAQQWIALTFVLLLSLCLLGTLLDLCTPPPPQPDRRTSVTGRRQAASDLRRKQVVGRRANVGEKRHWQYQVYHGASGREDYSGSEPNERQLGEQRNPLVHGPATNLFCAIHGHKSPLVNNTTGTSAASASDDQDDESWIAQLEQNQANFERHQLTDRLAPAGERGSPLGPRSVEILLSAIRCFSLRRSLKAVGKLKRTESASGLADIKVIHGLRTLTMVWIIFGHTIGLVSPEMMNNLFSLARLACSSRLLQALLNATLAVNTFFMISGLVTVVSLARKCPSIRQLLTETPHLEGKHQKLSAANSRRLQEELPSCSTSGSTSSILSSSLESNSTSSHHRCIQAQPVGGRSASQQVSSSSDRSEFQPLLWLAMRYLRLTPAYAATVGLAVLLTSLGSGPFWAETAGQLGAACRRNWWTNLAYVNNFVDTDQLCLIHSWYLSNDWQFFLMALALLWCLYRSRRLAFLLLVTLAVAGASATFAITVINGFPPTIVTTSPAVAERWLFIHSLYYKPWPHLGSYLVGLITGYLLVRRQQLSSPAASSQSGGFRPLLAWSLCALIAFALLNSIYPWNMGLQVDPNIAGLHSATFRTLWAACCAWLVYTLADNEHNWLAKLLGWSGFQLPSRLTYCAYLMHPLIIYYDFGMLRERLDSSMYGQLHRFAAILGMSYAAALLLSLLVEAPSIQVQQLLVELLIRKAGPQKEPASKLPARSRRTSRSDSWTASSSFDDQESHERAPVSKTRRKHDDKGESFNLLLRNGSQLSSERPSADKPRSGADKANHCKSISEDIEQSKGALDDGDFQQKLAQAIGRGFRIRARMASGLLQPTGTSKRTPLSRPADSSVYRMRAPLGDRSAPTGNKARQGLLQPSSGGGKQLSTFFANNTCKDAPASSISQTNHSSVH